MVLSEKLPLKSLLKRHPKYPLKSTLTVFLCHRAGAIKQPYWTGLFLYEKIQYYSTLYGENNSPSFITWKLKLSQDLPIAAYCYKTIFLTFRVFIYIWGTRAVKTQFQTRNPEPLRSMEDRLRHASGPVRIPILLHLYQILFAPEEEQ